MLIGLVGPTDYSCMRRQKIGECFSAHVFFFQDLTIKFIRTFDCRYEGKTWDDLIHESNRYGLCCLLQQTEDRIRSINKNYYTDWMGQVLATTVFRKGLKATSAVTEAVIGDVKYPEQQKWLSKFAVDRNSRNNRTVLVDSAGLPPELASHEGETAYLEFNIDAEFSETEERFFKRETNKIRKLLYIGD